VKNVWVIGCKPLALVPHESLVEDYDTNSRLCLIQYKSVTDMQYRNVLTRARMR